MTLIKILQGNLNALIALKFPEDTQTAVAERLGLSEGFLSRLRNKQDFAVSFEMLEQLAERLDVSAADLLTPHRYDSLDRDGKDRGVPSPVTPSHGKNTTVTNNSGGGHALLASSERHRIVQLESCLHSVLGLLGQVEKRAVEVRAVLHAAGITPPASRAGKARTRRIRG